MGSAKDGENKKDSDMEWACRKLISLANKGFYGEIIIKMEDGHIKLLKETRTFKPQEQ